MVKCYQKLLEKLFLEKGIKSFYPVESNMVFVPINETQIQNLSKKYDLHYWNEETKIVRFAATANSTQEEMEELVGSL